MHVEKRTSRDLKDPVMGLKAKISLLWAATLFCYLYADVLTLFRPDVLEQIATGDVAGFEIDQRFLLGSAVLMSIPVLMIFLSLALRSKPNRYMNIGVATAHIGLAIITATMSEGWIYYIFLSGVEIIFLSLIIWYAWHWPQPGTGANPI